PTGQGSRARTLRGRHHCRGGRLRAGRRLRCSEGGFAPPKPPLRIRLRGRSPRSKRNSAGLVISRWRDGRMIHPDKRRGGLADRLAFVLASVGGAGYSPVVPGTVGSLVTVVALWLIPFSQAALLGTILVVSVLGIWAGERVERALGAKDPGVIVIDEVPGMLLSVFTLPPTVPVLIAAFILFRVFDIWKPFPARQSQSLSGGFGVMVDDLIAGLYALLALLATRAMFGL